MMDSLAKKWIVFFLECKKFEKGKSYRFGILSISVISKEYQISAR